MRAKEGQGTSKIRHEGHQQGFQRLDKILLEDLIIKFGYVSCLCMDLVDTIKMHQCPESKATTAVVLALHLSLLIWSYQIKTNVILQMYYCELGQEVACYLQELAEPPFCYNKQFLTAVSMICSEHDVSMMCHDSPCVSIVNNALKNRDRMQIMSVRQSFDWMDLTIYTNYEERLRCALEGIVQSGYTIALSHFPF